jgi:hypothetical protein
MTQRADLLARFTGKGSGAPLYLPDLTLWHEWHQGQGTLPLAWRDLPLSEIASALGVPAWLPVRPWKVETRGVEIVTTEQDGERVVRSETSAGALRARWTLGPDGDWWQTEYPVKAHQDLALVLELVKARSYVLDPAPYTEAAATVGDDGIVALQIPRRPYSDLLHDFLGWSEGLLFLADPVVLEIIAILEDKLQQLVREVAQVPGDLVMSPDNLDGQFISPRAFKERLFDSYTWTAKELHAHGKALLVHIGGPIRHLLSALAKTGIDGLEGIAGPPQSNATLAEARNLAGTEITLWGGIPQDFLLEAHEHETFEAAVRQAAQEASGDRGMILGVADRVPVDADLSRLEAIPSLIERAS